tara:strand:+ start:248 stop:457 length:210 start_codon:yes stop_codon:yes gene_type:complete
MTSVYVSVLGVAVASIKMLVSLLQNASGVSAVGSLHCAFKNDRPKINEQAISRNFFISLSLLICILAKV